MSRKKWPSVWKSTSRGRREIRIAVAILVALLLAYTVVANLLLQTESGRRLIMPRSERVELDWKEAWTMLPGLIHVSELALTVDNRHLAWGLRAERSSLWINLLALPSRHVSILRARANGFACHFNQPESEEGPLPKRRKRPWRISLSNVQLDGLRSCTIGDYRLSPVDLSTSTRISGGLDLRLRGPVELRKVRLQLADTQLLDAERTVAEFSKLDATIDSQPFQVKLVKGRELLRSLSGEIDVAGETRSLGFINEFLAKAQWLDLESGTGHLETRLVFDRGLLLPGSRVQFESDEVSIQYLDYIALGRAEVGGTIEGSTPALVAAYREFSLRQDGIEKPYVVGNELRIRIDASSGDLADMPEVRLQLDIPRSQVPDLTVYNGLMPERAGLEITAGSGTMEAHLVLSTGDVPATTTADDSLIDGTVDRRVPDALAADGGWVKLASPDFGVRTNDLEIRGALTVAAEIEDVDTQLRALRLSRARVGVSDAAVERAHELLRSDWQGAFELDDGDIALSRPLRGRTSLQLSMTDVQPILAFFAEKKPRIETVSKILDVENIRGFAELKLGENLLTIDGLEITGDRIEVQGRLCLGSDLKAGAIHVRAFGVGLASSFFGADKRWTLIRPRRWYERNLVESSCAPI